MTTQKTIVAAFQYSSGYVSSLHLASEEGEDSLNKWIDSSFDIKDGCFCVLQFEDEEEAIASYERHSN